MLLVTSLCYLETLFPSLEREEGCEITAVTRPTVLLLSSLVCIINRDSHNVGVPAVWAMAFKKKAQKGVWGQRGGGRRALLNVPRGQIRGR